MKAIIQKAYGSTDVFELREVDRPAIGESDVLVRVRAAGVDRGVWHLMTGLPYPVRFAGYGVLAPKSPVPGMDLSGTVESVGAAVTRFRPGDEVFGFCQGAYAEFARAPEERLAPKPAGITFEQAAATSTSGTTALQAVRDHGRVRPGQRVLVIGASGGVGSFAVQLAKAAGADVTAVSSSAKADLVRSLGADQVVEYERDDFAAADPRYDVVLDIGGNATLSRLRRALAPKGTLVIAGGENGGRWLGGTDRQIRARVLSPFVGQTLTSFIAKQRTEDLLVLGRLIEAGKVTPVVDRSYSLDEVAEAIAYLEAGRARGKVVIAA